MKDTHKNLKIVDCMLLECLLLMKTQVETLSTLSNDINLPFDNPVYPLSKYSVRLDQMK